MKPSRRKFLTGLGCFGAASVATPFAWPARYPRFDHSWPVLDIHTHLFGVLEKNGCWISKTQREHWTHPYLLNMLGIADAEDIDEAYVQRLVGMVRESSVDKIVLQAWDGRINANGIVDKRETTSLIVPNDYLFKIVRRYPDLFIPCASINPYREDALDELNRCADLGARMVKVHPPTMDVDPNKPCLTAYYRLCRERNIVVMVHTGHEHAADITGIHNCDPAKLELALEEGCTVIAAHAGSGQFHDRLDFYEHFTKLIARFPNLYCDNSIMGSMLHWRNLPAMLHDSGIIDRMIHGSDFPFPANGLVFWNRISPRMTARLATETNMIERDFQLKRALGVPKEVFERGAKLLGIRF